MIISFLSSLNYPLIAGKAIFIFLLVIMLGVDWAKCAFLQIRLYPFIYCSVFLFNKEMVAFCEYSLSAVRSLGFLFNKEIVAFCEYSLLAVRSLGFFPLFPSPPPCLRLPFDAIVSGCRGAWEPRPS